MSDAGGATSNTDRDAAVLGACAALAQTTAALSRECCCNLYSINENGTTSYFTGEIFEGGSCDVAVRFLTDAYFEKLRTQKNRRGRRVRRVGFIHSHPYSAKRERPGGGYEDAFSGADGTVARLTGAIYMVSPDGRIYLLTRGGYRQWLKAGGSAEWLTALACADMRASSTDTPFAMPSKGEFCRMTLKRCIKLIFKRRV